LKAEERAAAVNGARLHKVLADLDGWTGERQPAGTSAGADAFAQLQHLVGQHGAQLPAAAQHNVAALVNDMASAANAARPTEIVVFMANCCAARRLVDGSVAYDTYGAPTSTAASHGRVQVRFCV
jgi:hypothetical protein